MKKYNNKNFIKAINFIIILIFILIVSYFIPTAYHVISPGIATELSPMITVEGGIKNHQGSFLLTAVSSKRANIWDYVHIKLFNPEGIELKLIDEHLPPGVDIQQYIEIQEELMEESKLQSQALAFEKAGFEYKMTGEGALIIDLQEEGTAYSKLKKEDIIVAIDGEEVQFATDAADLIRKRNMGDIVDITVKRDNERLKYSLETIELEENPDKPSIGIFIKTNNLEYHFEREVAFDTDKIVGPSAGIMFVLEIYNQLTPEDITQGKKIAGTGSVTIDGNVHMIDGVKQKIMAAEKINADIFLVPAGNYEEAKQVAKNIQVIKIENIDQFFEYMNSNFYYRS